MRPRGGVLVGFSSCVSTPITASAGMFVRCTQTPPSARRALGRSFVHFQLAIFSDSRSFSWERLLWAAWSKSPLGKATCSPRKLLISRLFLREKGPGRASRGQLPWPRHSDTPLPGKAQDRRWLPTARRLSPNSSSAPAGGSACRGSVCRGVSCRGVSQQGGQSAGESACAKAWPCDPAWLTALTK